MCALIARGVDGIQFIPPLARGAYRVRRSRNRRERICARRLDVVSFDTASAVGSRDGHLFVCVTAVCDRRGECGLGHVVVNTIMRALVPCIVDGI